jgi:hypothetical protein
MNIALALELLTNLALQLHKLSGLIGTARAEGRDITSEELDALAGEDDVARAVFQKAIDDAKAAGG